MAMALSQQQREPLEGSVRCLKFSFFACTTSLIRVDLLAVEGFIGFQQGVIGA